MVFFPALWWLLYREMKATLFPVYVTNTSKAWIINEGSESLRDTPPLLCLLTQVASVHWEGYLHKKWGNFGKHFSFVSGHVDESLALRQVFSSYFVSSHTVVPPLLHYSSPISYHTLLISLIHQQPREKKLWNICGWHIWVFPVYPPLSQRVFFFGGGGFSHFLFVRECVMVLWSVMGQTGSL